MPRPIFQMKTDPVEFREAIEKLVPRFEKRGVDVYGQIRALPRFFGVEAVECDGIVVDAPELRQWRSVVGAVYSVENYHPQPQRRGFLEQLVGGLDFQTALEVGCNVGNNLDVLYAMGKKVYGLDPLESVLVDNRWSNLVGTAFALPFQERKFDLVLCAGVLCHISPERIIAALNEIIRVCNKYLVVIDYDSRVEDVQVFRGTYMLWRRDLESYLGVYSGLKRLASGLTSEWDYKSEMRYMIWRRNGWMQEES